MLLYLNYRVVTQEGVKILHKINELLADEKR